MFRYALIRCIALLIDTISNFSALCKASHKADYASLQLAIKWFMTRSDLIRSLSFRFPALKAADAEICVHAILGALHDTLAAGNRVEIRGFGSFDLNFRGPRTGRNPATGEKVEIPGKYIPHFKSGLALRGRVNGATPSAPIPAPNQRSNPFGQ